MALLAALALFHRITVLRFFSNAESYSVLAALSAVLGKTNLASRDSFLLIGPLSIL